MTRAKNSKVEQERCAWEAGELGNSAAHAEQSSPEHDKAVDDAMGLQMISIRLPKSLIEDLKYFAEREGLGYQPLIRRVLLRWTSHEYKLAAQERFASSLATAATQTADSKQVSADDDDDDDDDVRMAAYG